MVIISPKTYWVIGIAAVVVVGVLLYWAALSRVPSPDLSGIRQQNQAAQRESAAKQAAKAAAGIALRAAATQAAETTNPLRFANPVAKVTKTNPVQLKLQ